jgi:hypothetical protein
VLCLCVSLQVSCAWSLQRAGDGRRPPTQSGGRRPPILGDGRRTPVLGDGRRTPVLGDGRRTPVLGDGRRTPVLGGGRRTPVLGDGRRTPVLGDGRVRRRRAQVRAPPGVVWEWALVRAWGLVGGRGWEWACECVWVRQRSQLRHTLCARYGAGAGRHARRPRGAAA